MNRTALCPLTRYVLWLACASCPTGGLPSRFFIEGPQVGNTCKSRGNSFFKRASCVNLSGTCCQVVVPSQVRKTSALSRSPAPYLHQQPLKRTPATLGLQPSNSVESSDSSVTLRSVGLESGFQDLRPFPRFLFLSMHLCTCDKYPNSRQKRAPHRTPGGNPAVSSNFIISAGSVTRNPNSKLMNSCSRNSPGLKKLAPSRSVASDIAVGR